MENFIFCALKTIHVTPSKTGKNFMYMFNFLRVSTEYSRVLIGRLVSVQCCNYKMSSGSICLTETRCLKSTLLWPFKDQCSHHIETSHLICRANQLTGFYAMGTLVVKGLKQKKSEAVTCRVLLNWVLTT